MSQFWLQNTPELRDAAKDAWLKHPEYWYRDKQFLHPTAAETISEGLAEIWCVWLCKQAAADTLTREDLLQTSAEMIVTYTRYWHQTSGQTLTGFGRWDELTQQQQTNLVNITLNVLQQTLRNHRCLTALAVSTEQPDFQSIMHRQRKAT